MYEPSGDVYFRHATRKEGAWLLLDHHQDRGDDKGSYAGHWLEKVLRPYTYFRHSRRSHSSTV